MADETTGGTPASALPPGEVTALITCGKCGKPCKNKVGLAVHQAKCGKPKSGRVSNKRKAATRTRTNPAAAPTPATLIREVFAGASGVIDAQAELLAECVAGYEAYVAKMKKLRLAYMKIRGKLAKLRAQAGGFGPDSIAPEEEE